MAITAKEACEGCDAFTVLDELMKPANKTEQERFEQWAVKKGFDLRKSIGGNYVVMHSSYAWMGWQAAVSEIICPKCGLRQLKSDDGEPTF